MLHSIVLCVVVVTFKLVIFVAEILLVLLQTIIAVNTVWVMVMHIFESRKKIKTPIDWRMKLQTF